jgi:hypothetical protein
MQIERRKNPYPLTWEIPAGTTAFGALLLVLGVHLGRAVANWTAGAGWHWPKPTALFTALPAILAGNASAGLDTSLRAGATSGQLLAWVMTVEIAILIAGIVAAAAGLRRWGPTRLKGMATSAEAESALGLSRLRRVRSIIRPDLHPATGGRLTIPTSEESDHA